MSLLSSIGGLVGFAMGGPAGAAIGSGLGSLAGGGDIKDAFQSAAMSFAGGQGGGIMNAVGAMGGQGGGGNKMAQLAQMFANQGGGGNKGGGGGGIGSIMDNPAVMAALLRASEPESIKITSALQDAQLATGERLPNFRGVGMRETRPGMSSRPQQFTNRPTYAQGGLIEGPGTGTSDSIPGAIMQNGKPVEEIRVANNEFILREKDVEQIGNGDRNLGAAKLYAMQRRFDNGARA